MLKDVDVKVLSDNQAKLMEGYLTTTELSIALKNTKNNTTPGLDGFPSEFFKVFWKDLKYIITKALNSSYDKGLLPLSLRQCYNLPTKKRKTT